MCENDPKLVIYNNKKHFDITGRLADFFPVEGNLDVALRHLVFQLQLVAMLSHFVHCDCAFKESFTFQLMIQKHLSHSEICTIFEHRQVIKKWCQLAIFHIPRSCVSIL